MSSHKINLLVEKINNHKYELIYEQVSVAKAAEIDYESYSEDGYSSFLEMKSMLSCINFKIIKDGELYYDSQNLTESLDFNLAKVIYDALRKSAFLSEEDSTQFKDECELYLKDESTNRRMPYELLLAKNIFNQDIKISLDDFENMDIKKYEKIQLALAVLRKKVAESE
jgi:hypothetical protein